MSANTTSPTKAQPLSDRSTNIFLSPGANNTSKMCGDSAADIKAATSKSMDYHRQVLKEKLEEGKMKAPGHYISPSDGIMSPCTKKLSDLKGKKFKNAKPQVLFAKALAKKSYDKMSSESPSEDGPTA
ncbi:hypothetical protein LOZ57_004958 [Ophidiomyces ophidiicola]|uniref:uncharacterized protein n=1 Tax=Ophidiomyces ophidiicola TaxID=1387563 RepID=UPI0020C2B51B|nr:uncharacterized protein LOZ57_004958 [Ophidiomyces ophidiicola]KAI1944281.1 hypothetical protein LOZ57_004958 [Ophidiomyces ophidiicola]KAI2061207.1 hypothetical protein LOZ43_001241 [Ophidiomyces ophidiicola]